MTEHTEGHIVRRYDSELAHLRDMVLEMGGLVLFQLDQFVVLLGNSSEKLAKQIIERDNDVNSLDIQSHREVLKILAKRAPVATDLRTTISAAKVVTELEHIGDELVKVSCLYIDIQDSKPQLNENLLQDAKAMGEMARTMLRAAVDSFDTVNIEKSVHVAKESRELENEFQATLQKLTNYRLLENDNHVGNTLSMVLIINAMERIGHHTKNIAEYVVYMAKGKDVRHVGLDKLFEEIYVSN